MVFLQQLAEGLDPAVRDSVKKYMDLPDVVIVTKLRSIATGQEVTVGNVHIIWAEMKMPDAQCVQVRTRDFAYSNYCIYVCM